MAEKIGFLGMGLMGRLMAARVLEKSTEKGYDLMVYNRTQEKTRTLAEAGAEVARTPAEIARWADLLILMLTGPEAVDAVLEGEEGILGAQGGAKTLINMSTVPPKYSRNLERRLQEKGLVFVEAPVAGSVKPAKTGDLAILAGGPQERVNELAELLECMGKKIIYCGPVGMGTAMKMSVNLLLGIMMEGICEAVNFGEKCGLDRDFVFNVLTSGALGSGLYNGKAEMILSGEYDVEFPFRHLLKDIGFVLETAEENGAAAPAASNLSDLLAQGVDRGLGDLDMAALKKVLEDLSTGS